MAYSMTAFARVQKQLDDSVLCWEIKSVNHRYLDVSFRLPEAFRFMETQLRSILRDQVSRGKLECQLKYQDISLANQSVSINEGLVNALMEAAQQLSVSRHVANDLSISHVLSWPGVVQANQVDTELLSQQAELVFKEAISQLIAAREKEGEALTVHIFSRLNSLDEEIIKARQLASLIAPQSKDKLMTRLNSLQMDVMDTRIEQEIALIIARLDISEELDRLHTHVTEIKRIIGSESIVGRRLDFLMQELNREANTLSSKSDSVELTQCAVEMKVYIEQMREQIQNIE